MEALNELFFEMEDEAMAQESAEYDLEFEGESEGVLSEMEEMELVAELMEVTNEAELEQFLGKAFKKIGRAVGGFVRSPTGKALGGMLKNVAMKALPIAGTTLGNLVAPGVGGIIGNNLGNMAADLLGGDLEMMNQEDREFEVAHRFVKLTTAATANAVRDQGRGGQPMAMARTALAKAAKTHAPGLLATKPTPSPCPHCRGKTMTPRPGGVPVTTTGGLTLPTGKSGRWVRQGRRVMLFNG